MQANPKLILEKWLAPSEANKLPYTISGSCSWVLEAAPGFGGLGLYLFDLWDANRNRNDEKTKHHLSKMTRNLDELAK